MLLDIYSWILCDINVTASLQRIMSVFLSDWHIKQGPYSTSEYANEDLPGLEGLLQS